MEMRASLIMGDGVPVSLFHMAVGNPRVHEFFPKNLVSQARVEFHRVRLGVQEEGVDAFQIGASFNGGDQQLADAKASVRPVDGHAPDFGRRAAILQHGTRRSHGLAIGQCDKMKGCAVMLVAFQIGRNALFDDKDLGSDPKALLDVLRHIGSSDGDHRSFGVQKRFW